MHEYSITKNIVDIALQEAEKAHSSKIKEITLVIGDLSSVIDESVTMYFEIISSGTAAENAKLVFKRVPAEFVCTICKNKYEKPVRGFDCPICGGAGKLTDAGREFYIESMEVE